MPLEIKPEINPATAERLQTQINDLCDEFRGVFSRETVEQTVKESLEAMIEHLRHSLGLNVSGRDSRRNIVTRMVGLNDLVGVEFSLGAVRLRGTGLCEPFISLVKSPENRHLLRGLVHKGGLRAEILCEGVIKSGDDVRTHTEARLAAVGRAGMSVSPTDRQSRSARRRKDAAHLEPATRAARGLDGAAR